MERQYYDQFSDPSFRRVFKLVQANPEIEEHVKTASIDIEDNEKRADHAFAWPERRLFPIDSPPHAYLSKLFIEKQAGVPEVVKTRCDKALALYGVEVQIHEKTAAESEPSADEYLLPEIRRLRVKTASDVSLASDAIQRNYKKMDVNTRARACTNLVKKAAEYNTALPIEILKFAGATICDTQKLKDWIEARAEATLDPQLSYGFRKMAEEVSRLPRLCGDRDELVKVADTLTQLDDAAGLARYYDRALLDPLSAVFNTDKIADEVIDVAGQQIPLETLLAIDPEVYKDTLGEDLAGEFVRPDGIDAEQLKIILPTVPYDLQKVLASQIGQVG